MGEKDKVVREMMNQANEGKLTRSDKFEEYIIEGYAPSMIRLKEQTVYRFPNDYGASVIYGELSRGLELAVLSFDSYEVFRIDYDTPITDDVVGYIEDLDGLLEQIKAL